jgi:hypothetical protein
MNLYPYREGSGGKGKGGKDKAAESVVQPTALAAEDLEALGVKLTPTVDKAAERAKARVIKAVTKMDTTETNGEDEARSPEPDAVEGEEEEDDAPRKPQLSKEEAGTNRHLFPFCLSSPLLPFYRPHVLPLMCAAARVTQALLAQRQELKEKQARYLKLQKIRSKQRASRELAQDQEPRRRGGAADDEPALEDVLQEDEREVDIEPVKRDEADEDMDADEMEAGEDDAPTKRSKPKKGGKQSKLSFPEPEPDSDAEDATVDVPEVDRRRGGGGGKARGGVVEVDNELQNARQQQRSAAFSRKKNVAGRSRADEESDEEEEEDKEKDRGSLEIVEDVELTYRTETTTKKKSK